MSLDCFRDQFETALRTGAKALETAGYDVNGYSASISHSQGNSYTSHQEDPLSALGATLEQAKEKDESLFIPVGSQELAEAVQEGKEIEDLVYQNIRGGIDIEDPEVEPEWAKNPLPAFGTRVEYIPEPDPYFEVGTAETQPPFTTEDAERRVEDIINNLRDAGKSAKTGFVE